jgi:CDP-4-dehydro-6-deoxyglucose reductase
VDVDVTVPSARCLPGAETHTAPGRIAPGRASPGTANAEITELQWLSADVIRVVLALPAETAFDYLPGQYLAVASDDRKHRCFSMAAPSSGGLLELHVRHWPAGGFSHWLAEGARIGDRIRIDGPYGNFVWRSQDSAGVILLATGTGIAPIIAMLTSTLADPDARAPIRLYWGVRRHAELYRALLFRRWEKQHPRFAFVPVVSRRDDTDSEWPSAMRVQDIALAEVTTLRGVDVYASGSPDMVKDAREKFLARADFSPDRLFSDAFEPAGSVATSEPATPAITLRLGDATGSLSVPARIGETLLAALKRTGAPLLAVCGGQASCGTCKVEIAPAWYARLPPARQVERNLLACLPDSKPGDRLACQIALTAELDGLEICPSG